MIERIVVSDQPDAEEPGTRVEDVAHAQLRALGAIRERPVLLDGRRQRSPMHDGRAQQSRLELLLSDRRRVEIAQV